MVNTKLKFGKKKLTKKHHNLMKRTTRPTNLVKTSFKQQQIALINLMIITKIVGIKTIENNSKNSSMFTDRSK